MVENVFTGIINGNSIRIPLRTIRERRSALHQGCVIDVKDEDNTFRGVVSYSSVEDNDLLEIRVLPFERGGISVNDGHVTITADRSFNRIY